MHATNRLKSTFVIIQLVPSKGTGGEKTKIRNIFGTRFRGALGKDMVAASWKGHAYIREYFVPSNPRTELQVMHRALFNQAVEVWKQLSPRQKEFYNQIADGMSGYNLFIGRFIKSVRNGIEPELPIPMQWHTENGQPIEDSWLIVRQRNDHIFADNLEDAKGEVALTPSDVPYTFVLRKGTKEDEVLTVEDLLETDVPFMLESKELGIKLVADVEAPEMEAEAVPVEV